VTPFLDDKPHGLFATRAPKRPNPIGLSLVELTAIDDNVLHIRGADVIDGTPLLDIKPYVEAFDYIQNSRSGWLTASLEQISEKRSDTRFTQ
jgi:tRNA-Thr(GGU) m(6)t(6)A37 methyltransferase TsaA